jgi:hypothetical protein
MIWIICIKIICTIVSRKHGGLITFKRRTVEQVALRGAMPRVVAVVVPSSVIVFIITSVIIMGVRLVI